MTNLSVSGTSNLGANVTTTGTQTYTGAVTLSSDVVFSSSNSNIIFITDITGLARDLTVSTGLGNIRLNAVGTPSAYVGDVVLNSSGVITLDGRIYAASIRANSAGDVIVNGAVLVTTGTQTYQGQVTLTGNTTITTSSLNIMQNLISQSNLILNSGNDGAGEINPVLGSINITGTLTLVGTLNANSISVGGDVMLNGTIRTTGDQVWTGPNSIILTGNSSLISGDDLYIGRKIYSELSTPYNLVLRSLNEDSRITIANDIGIIPTRTELNNDGISLGNRLIKTGRIGILTVSAGNSNLGNIFTGQIDILADITTANMQYYNAKSINIGSVEEINPHNRIRWNLSGTDGYSQLDQAYVHQNNPKSVRTLISEDPTIDFNGDVNDANQLGGVHSLIALSISPDRNTPTEVYFRGQVGKERKLYSLTIRTLEYVEGVGLPKAYGLIGLGGSVSTVVNQTFETEIFELLGNAAITLSSDSGKIRVLADSYTMTVGLSLDYSFANPPEIRVGSGLIRLPDLLRDVPSTDVSAGVLSGKLMRMAVFSDESNDSSVEAEVSVGNLEEGGATDCAPNSTADECQVNWQ